MKRRSKPKISFSSFRLAAGGLGGAAQKNERKFLGLPRATSGSASEARREHHHALRAYDFVSSHHARGACEDQSLRDWKKVRAKVNTSPPIFTFARNGKSERVAKRHGMPFLRRAPRFFQSQSKRAVAHEVVRMSKILWILLIQCSNFVQETPPMENHSGTISARVIFSFGREGIRKPD
ncbi:MAG: hypothetical protein CMI56_03080 [Parcubacteria group bacterium]|nr:hypothetical protein [Parcubacteria group bacterium]